MLPTLNLNATTLPVLTFFHRYSIYWTNNSCGKDYLYLEISTNGGFNWTQIKSWEGANVAWTYEQVDLSNYRINLVKIRFRLSSHNGCSGTGDGWYIDDVSMLEKNNIISVQPLPFSDNFESGFTKWIRGGFNWDTTRSTYTSPINSATDSRVGNYSYLSSPTLATKWVFDLSNTILPALTFFHKYSIYWTNNSCGKDYLYLEVSTNDGYSWNNLRTWEGANNAWTPEQINLSAYIGDSIKIRFVLSSYNGCSGTGDGWYIDDVTIRDLATGITQTENIIPDRYSIMQNFPNPFNPSTNIEFSVPKQSNVKINVYDSQGKEVAALLNEKLSAGTYRVDFDGTGYSSGVYFYKMETEDFVQTRSMVLLK